MAATSMFVAEEAHVVRLVPGGTSDERIGWVNIGVHSVKLQLNARGDLVLETYARMNENDELAKVVVAKAAALAAGGNDPDQRK